MNGAALYGGGTSVLEQKNLEETGPLYARAGADPHGANIEVHCGTATVHAFKKLKGAPVMAILILRASDPLILPVAAEW